MDGETNTGHPKHGAELIVSRRKPEESETEPQKDTENTSSPDEHDPDPQSTVKEQMNTSVPVSETEGNTSQTKPEPPADREMQSDDNDLQSKTNVSPRESNAQQEVDDPNAVRSTDSPQIYRKPEESETEPQKDTENTSSPDEHDPDPQSTVKEQMKTSVPVSETEGNASQTKPEPPADREMQSDDNDLQSKANVSLNHSGVSDITSDYSPKIQVKKKKKGKKAKNERHPSPAETRDYCGLTNQGSTCYLNAVLQTLFMTQDFRRAVLESQHSWKDVSSELQKLFRSLESNKRSVSTKGVTNALNIRNVCEQQDAAEYLQKILSEIDPKAAKIFQGKKKHSTTCLGSKHSPVEEENSFYSLAITLDSDYSGPISVIKSFTAQFEVMLMDGEDQLFCEKCDTMMDMEMSCSIPELPDVLTLHLKRFYLDYNYMTYRKNNRPVKIPLQLEVQDECGVHYVYDLYAVVNHTGSLSGGHYYAHIKSFEDQQWYEFNDSWVYRIEKPCIDCISEAACLLFFRKRSERPLNTPSEANELEKSTENHLNVQPNIRPKSKQLWICSVFCRLLHPLSRLLHPLPRLLLHLPRLLHPLLRLLLLL